MGDDSAGAAQAPSPATSFERYRDYLRFLARTALDPRLARKLDPSDIVQDTLLKAHAARDTLRAADDLQTAGWLREILSNQLSNAVRDNLRGRRDVRREVPLEAYLARSSTRLASLGATPASTASAKLVAEETAVRLAAAVERLPGDQREALILKYWHDWPLEWIGKRQDRTPNAVACLIHRAIRGLREELVGSP